MTTYSPRPTKNLAFSVEQVLYTSLVQSQLTYCSPIWRLQFLKDIQSIENVLRRATKFILHDYKSCYKSRLVALHLLPLMMQFELIDILFFISSQLNASTFFNMLPFLQHQHAQPQGISSFTTCVEQIVTDTSTLVVCPIFGILFQSLM